MSPSLNLRAPGLRRRVYGQGTGAEKGKWVPHIEYVSELSSYGFGVLSLSRF